MNSAPSITEDERAEGPPALPMAESELPAVEIRISTIGIRISMTEIRIPMAGIGLPKAIMHPVWGGHRNIT
jgi:hypothetical protein